MNKREEKQKRVDTANRMIAAISSCGRKFFNHKGRISHFEMDGRGRIWFIDGYTQKRIYTHCKWSKWRGFTEGGTLMALIQSLQKYIVTGDQPRLNLGPWPDYLCNGDLWGYGDHAMGCVREAAVNLGLR